MCLISSFSQLFPGRQPVMKLLETLQMWLVSLPLDKIPYDAILDLVNNKMRVSLYWVSEQNTFHWESRTLLPGPGPSLVRVELPSPWARTPRSLFCSLSSVLQAGAHTCLFQNQKDMSHVTVKSCSKVLAGLQENHEYAGSFF